MYSKPRHRTRMNSKTKTKSWGVPRTRNLASAWQGIWGGTCADRCLMVSLLLDLTLKRDISSGCEDIWWMVWGVLLVAIIERGNIMDEDKKWFDLFRVLFELVSAFGGIGLSLGFPSVFFPPSVLDCAADVRCRITCHSWGR